VKGAIGTFGSWSRFSYRADAEPCAQGPDGVTRRQAARELRRDHPLLLRELARMRRQDPQRFQDLRRRLQQRYGRARGAATPDRPPVRDF